MKQQFYQEWQNEFPLGKPAQIINAPKDTRDSFSSKHSIYVIHWYSFSSNSLFTIFTYFI